MFPFELPDPGPAEALPFGDVAGARAWLARQPQAQPSQMQAILQKAVAAVDTSDLAAATQVAILDVLRSAIILTQAATESRYSRKPLPLPAGDADTFFAARRLWRSLAVAYLRTVPRLPPAEAARPLHRAAVSLRAEHFAHLLAAYEVPAKLLQLLYGILMAGESLGVLQLPQEDPDNQQVRESHIAGHVAWAFLLQFVHPYRLSMAQLTVTNRAFSRWRELAAFRREPDPDPRSRNVLLANLLGEMVEIQGGPAWLDVRAIGRKIRSRLEALEAGESPESLKLGRELSSTACVRLLRQLNDALKPARAADGGGKEEISLCFGAENIYALLAQETFDSSKKETQPRLVNHQRLAVFGFDNLVTPVEGSKGAQVDSETWQVADGYAWRGPDNGRRLLSPSLVGQGARIGILTELLVATNGKLRARLQWYPGPVRAAAAPLPVAGSGSSRVPFFILGEKVGQSVILPAGATVRPASRIVPEGETSAPLVLGQVLERGSDFVRYAVAPA